MAHELPAPDLPHWISRELPFRRYMLDVGGKNMHVMEVGAGRPVLMVHGNPTWGYLYRKIASSLQAEGFRLIAPDLIGLGFSVKPRDAREHTLENHARWLGSAIGQLELRDAILVVQDWGGAIGVCASQAHPFAGLVVLNTVLSPPKKGFKGTAFHRFAHTPVLADIAFRGLGFPQIRLGIVQGDPRSMSGTVGRAYRYPLRRFADRVAPLALARMVPDSHTHPSIPMLERCQAQIEEFRGPAAIVWGDRDPVLGRVRSWMQKLLPQASMVQTQAGHFLQEEVPEEIAAAIREVARKLD